MVGAADQEGSMLPTTTNGRRGPLRRADSTPQLQTYLRRIVRPKQMDLEYVPPQRHLQLCGCSAQMKLNLCLVQVHFLDNAAALHISKNSVSSSLFVRYSLPANGWQVKRLDIDCPWLHAAIDIQHTTNRPKINGRVMIQHLSLSAVGW